MQVSSALGGRKDQEKELRICQNCLCIKEATVTKTVEVLRDSMVAFVICKYEFTLQKSEQKCSLGHSMHMYVYNLPVPWVVENNSN